jgi:hypothetical protein
MFRYELLTTATPQSVTKKILDSGYMKQAGEILRFRILWFHFDSYLVHVDLSLSDYLIYGLGTFYS